MIRITDTISLALAWYAFKLADREATARLRATLRHGSRMPLAVPCPDCR